jgi:hypothetical protein
MATFETDLLIELVDRKRQILAQLCQQGARQMKLIEHNDMGELLDVLAIKQKLIAALSLTERGLDPFRDQHPEERRWRAPAERDRCAKLLDDCQVLLEESMRQERQSEDLLRNRRDEAAGRLEQANSADRARHAYAMPETAPRQLDLSSEN